MERKTLYISSLRDGIAERFSVLIRELGRKTQRPLWGKSLSPDEDVLSLLYLDSGARGNLSVMASSMGADITEYVFWDKQSNRRYYLLSQRLKTEYKDGECVYKTSKNGGATLGERVRVLAGLKKCSDFYIVKEVAAVKSPVYSALCGEAKKNISEDFFIEGEFSDLIDTDELPEVIICDAFSQNGVFALLEKRFGKPMAIHIMNERNQIYAPYMSLGRELFIETEDFVKEALFAICLWLYDSMEEKSAIRLEKAFSPLARGEELIERTIECFMRNRKRRKAAER